jgi:YD repeat-containing protein
VPLGQAGADLGAKTAWRNRAQTSIGYVWMGGTWLKPDTGETLSFDPYGHDSSDTGHTPFNGNPIGYHWDPDGRLTSQTFRQANAASAFAVDQLWNLVPGTAAALNWVGGVAAQFTEPVLGISPTSFYSSMEQYQASMSPYGRAGYYDLDHPVTQGATYATVIAAPENVFGKGGTLLRTEQALDNMVAPISAEPAIQLELPFTYPRAAGGKTEGILVMNGQQTPIISGVRGPAQTVPRGSSGFDIVSRTHVEGHAAALMNQNNVAQATLYLNNVPCSSCTRNLPRALPPGGTLQVIGPDGSVITFRGGGQ